MKKKAKLDKKIIGERIYSLRTSKHLTQAQLAEKLNVGSNYISRIERGQSAPSTQMLYNLSLALEVSINYFFEPVFYGESTSDIILDIANLLHKCSEYDLICIRKIVKAFTKDENGQM